MITEEQKMKRPFIEAMMVSVRKNSEYSKCLDTYEALLYEIPDNALIRTTVSDMCRYIEEFILLSKEVDRVQDRRFKARFMTEDMLKPESFFRKTRKQILKYYKVLPWKEHTPFDPGKRTSGVDKEATRKIVLLWNYIPAITKAILQTKRRSLGLDKNSKRFG